MGILPSDPPPDRRGQWMGRRSSSYDQEGLETGKAVGGLGEPQWGDQLAWCVWDCQVPALRVPDPRTPPPPPHLRSWANEDSWSLKSRVTLTALAGALQLSALAFTVGGDGHGRTGGPRLGPEQWLEGSRRGDLNSGLIWSRMRLGLGPGPGGFPCGASPLPIPWPQSSDATSPPSSLTTLCSPAAGGPREPG